jgi:hypothetical protein
VTTGGEFLVYDGSRIPTVSSTQILNVIPGHSYKYRVLAINRVGESELSSFSETIVAAYKPDRPDQPRFVQATSDSMTLEFDKVEENGGTTIAFYKLYISDTQADDYEEIASYDGYSLVYTIQ